MIVTAVLAGAAMLHPTEVKEFTLTLVTHQLPFWFLVFSLFLPRVALIVAWFQGVLVPFHFLDGLVPLVVAILLPRVLILYLIYVDQGFSLWFLIHLVVALLVYAGGSHRISRRRYRNA